MPQKLAPQHGNGALRESSADGPRDYQGPVQSQQQRTPPPGLRQPQTAPSGQPLQQSQQVYQRWPDQLQRQHEQRLQRQQQIKEREQQVEAAAGGEGDEGNYYYYYQLPDGSWGYAPAGYAQQFSPVDVNDAATRQPAGYQEPVYGSSIGYHFFQGEDGYCYYYEAPQGAQPQVVGGQVQQQVERERQQQLQLLQQRQMMNGEVNMSNMLSGRGALPYTLPANHKEVRRWKGEQKWHGSVCCSWWEHPCYCLGATLCPCGFVCSQRKQMLGGRWDDYTCCAGLCGPKMCPSCSCKCGMCWESIFCLPCAMHANRFMLMKRYNVRPSSCDGAVSALGSVCVCCDGECCEYCDCCDEGQWARTTCDWLYCLAYPCLITQQHVMTKRMLHPKETHFK